MFPTRIATSSDTSSLHTINNIIDKLNSDLSEPERAGFLKILIESPDTLELLGEAALEWEKRLNDKFIAINTSAGVIDLPDSLYKASARYAEKSRYLLDRLLTEKKQLLKEQCISGYVQPCPSGSSDFAI